MNSNAVEKIKSREKKKTEGIDDEYVNTENNLWMRNAAAVSF